MPVKKCVKHGSKLYCYNKENGNVSVYCEQLYKLTECPESVVNAIINKDFDVEMIVEEQD